jgi:threonine dehydrogenase-like Zn-dependent dehydrogenase
MEPGALGHEGWGTIDAVGPEVDHFKIGDRVTMLSYHAYGQYDVASVDATVKLPDSLSGLPFPGEPLGCAVNIFRRSDIHPGQTVTIVGVGFMGAILVQLCARAGARVIGIDRRPCALNVARKMGAAETIILDGQDQIVEQVRQLTQGNLCDRVIEAVGKQGPLDLATELTKIRGKLIVAGYHQDGLRQINMQLWNWRGLDVINAHERDQRVYIEGIQTAVDAVVKGTLDPRPLFTNKYPMEQFGEALNALLQRPVGFMKALIIF